MYPWGAWQPDKAGPNSGVALIANNVLPQAYAEGIGYGPLAQLLTASGAGALAGAPRGGISVQKQDGTWQVFFASAAKIQLLQSDYTWSDIETGRTVTAGDDVSFCYFGKYLLNTDTTDGVKAYDVEAGGSNSAVSAAPANVRALFSCNNVVFALDIGGNNRRMQSSAVGSHSNWTTEGADGKTFEDGGALIGGRDLKNGLGIVFQESAIRLIQFGAGPGLYDIRKLADGKGAISDRSIVAFDGMVFWLATDGLYKYTAGGSIEPIGAEVVNRWLAANVAATEYENVQGAVDPFNKVIWWRLSASTLLGYDWQLGAFVTASAATSALTRIATPAVAWSGYSGTWADAMETWSSRTLQGGQPVFGALDSSYKFASFSGQAAEGTVRGQVIQGERSKRIVWATPVSDAGGSLLSVGTADALSSGLTYSDGAERNEDGEVPFDDRGRLFGFREVIPAGEVWTYTNGVDNIVLNEG